MNEFEQCIDEWATRCREKDAQITSLQTALDAEREKVATYLKAAQSAHDGHLAAVKYSGELENQLSQLQALVRALPAGSSMMRTDFVNGKWRVWDDLGEATLLGEFKNSDHAQEYMALLKYGRTLDTTTLAARKE